MAKKRILIVEDEESLLRLESILLSAKGYLVSGVTDGKSALEQICADRPDLVLLDIMLPLVDGFDVCRCLKANPETRAIPVVLLTARKNGQDYTRAMEVGADAYITKPFRSAHLAETIAGLLAGGNNGS